jgi:hypothetical protein
MLVETVLLVIIISFSAGFIFIPTFKVVKGLLSSKEDSLKLAQKRYEAAKKELEAYRIEKETNKIIEDLYNEVEYKEKNEKQR